MIKPDAVRRGLVGKVISRIEKEHLNIIDMKMIHMPLWRAKEFYSVHSGSMFFEPLVKFMSSGPVVVMVLKGPDAIDRWRSLMGATDSSKAHPGTIRGDFGDKEIIRKNIVHGSDGPETAVEEINFFFDK